MKSFRSKPLGWRGESYRHYLASKGVATGRRYLAIYGDGFAGMYGRMPQESEGPGSGNYKRGTIKALYRKGWTNEDLMAHPELWDRLQITYADVQRAQRYKRKNPQVPEREQVLGPAVRTSPLAAGRSLAFDQDELSAMPVPEPRVVESSVRPVQMPSMQPPRPPGLPEGEEPLDETFDEPQPVSKEVSRMNILTPGTPEHKSEFDRLE